METDDLLWQPLKGTAKRKRRSDFYNNNASFCREKSINTSLQERHISSGTCQQSDWNFYWFISFFSLYFFNLVFPLFWWGACFHRWLILMIEQFHKILIDLQNKQEGKKNTSTILLNYSEIYCILQSQNIKTSSLLRNVLDRIYEDVQIKDRGKTKGCCFACRGLGLRWCNSVSRSELQRTSSSESDHPASSSLS